MLLLPHLFRCGNGHPPTPISNRFSVVVTVVERSDVFKFKGIKLFRTKRLLVDVEPPLMKRGENSCPYPQISLFSPQMQKNVNWPRVS